MNVFSTGGYYYWPVMGCCHCLPDTDVLHDPTVTAHARVGDIAFVYQVGQDMIKGCGGLMYIKEDILYYEMECSGHLCCQSCRCSFNVKDITNVEVINDQVVRFHNKSLFLNPGLKITVKPDSGTDQTIIVAMPDAQEFAGQLGKLTASNKDQDII